MSIGKRIRETRISRGLTQEDVAKIVGVATQTIYKYEKEIVTNIPLGRLYKIAKALNTSTSYLFGDIDDPDDSSFRTVALDMAINDAVENVAIKEKAVKAAEKKHLEAVRSICIGNANYKAVTELYNLEFLPTRINMVTEFILANKEFLQKNMPGIADVEANNE